MTNATTSGPWSRRLSQAALLLCAGGVIAALVAAAGTGMEAWSFRTGFAVLRYSFFAAIAGAVLTIVAFALARRRGARIGWPNLAAFVLALLFIGFLGNQIIRARSVPAIHDATTDLADPPRFSRLTVRADNLEKIPDEGRPELAALDPESRWKAIHREAYGDLRPLRLSVPSAEALRQAEALARERGWTIANVDRQAGVVEATATTMFFRFKDDIVIRVRPDPGRPSGSLVDMRSISRVGGSDVGVNARRIRAFLADLQGG